MKKILALAALVLGLASCQTEPEGLNVNVGGEVDTYITVALPEATRANSADGFNLNNLGDYRLRYILEIYRVEDEQVLYSTCQRFVETSDNTSMVFPVRLAQDYDYRIVAWTDIVEGESKEDRYYYTAAGLDEIAILDNGTVNWNAMDETRDAYICVKVVDNFTSASNLDMTLTRPFAKVRVVATDIEDIRKVGLEPKSATVEYAQDMFFKYNAVAETYAHTNSKSHNISYPATPVYEDTTGEMTLFADYIFVPSTGTAKFSLNVYADANQSKLIKSNNFNTEIFVERNKLTTIKGDVLTVGGNVEVKIDNNLSIKETYELVDNAESLQDAIDEIDDNEVGNIVLGGDIDLGDLLIAGTFATRAGEPTYGLLIPAGTEVVLDLNGHTISQSKEQTGAYSMIDNKGTLTIEDSSANKSGNIAYGDTGNGGNYVSNTIWNRGVLTINGGTIENNSSATVASNGFPHPIDNYGVLTINGGTFTNNANYSSMRIWCTTDDDTIVTINGGTFNGSIDFQTPNAAANKGTLTIKGGTFNADTYTNCSVRLLGFGADVDEMNGYIKGGHFNGAIALKKFVSGDFNSKVFNITGGTFTVDPSEFVDGDYNVVKNNGVYSLELKDVIAKIGEVEYRTLQKAVNEAVNGDTITFIGNIEQVDGVIITDKNITIDLGGNTFTVTEGANTNNRNFKVNGSSVVTIKNGTMVAAGEITSGAYGTVRTEGTATVNLENVKLYSYRGYGLNVKACTGTTININNSEIYSQYSGGVEAAGGNIEMTNVKIEQKGVYSDGAWCSVAIGVNGNGNVTINSGNYSASTIASDSNAAQGTWVAYVMSSGGTLNIKGGTFNGVVAETASAANACGLICADRAAVVEIHGGTFNSNGAILDMRNNVGTQPNPKATLFGGTFSADPRVSGLYSSNLITVDSKSDIKEENGKWVVFVRPVAQIGETEYETLEAAVAAAQAGDTITLVEDVTLAEELRLPAGIIFNGNGKQINGSIYAGGDLTFAGHTKVTAFSASYYDRVITIGEGACLEVTGTGRVTLGYGNTFNITGSIENAKETDKATIQPSLIIPAGISITGGNGATMNVTNAYVKIGSTSSKPGVANGTFTLNFNNAIAEFTKEFGFYDPTGGVKPSFVMNIEDSVFTTGTKLYVTANSTVTVDNSNVPLGTYFRNSGTFTLENGSAMSGSTIQFGENGGNNGTINVDASTLTITTGNNKGHAFDGKGDGIINATNGATVSVEHYKAMTINVDATSKFTGTEVQ